MLTVGLMPFKYRSPIARLLANSVLDKTRSCNGSQCWTWTGARLDSGHFYNAACMLAGCALCREKWLNEDLDTLPDAAREAAIELVRLQFGA